MDRPRERRVIREAQVVRAATAVGITFAFFLGWVMAGTGLSWPSLLVAMAVLWAADVLWVVPWEMRRRIRRGAA